MRYISVIAVMVAFSIGGINTHASAKDKSGVLKASEMLGMKVEGNDGKKLGSIKDLVLDPEDGSIDYVVLDFGGIVGIGDKYFAVPWGAFGFSPDQKKLLISATKKDLKDAPGFDKQHWPDFSNQREVTTIYEFYEIPVPQAATTPPDKTNAPRQAK